MRPVFVSTPVAGGNSPAVPLDQYLTPFNISLEADINGVATYTVEWTQSDIWNTDPATWIWQPGPANLVGAVTSQVGSLISPVAAVRCRQTAGAGNVSFVVRQAGVMG